MFNYAINESAESGTKYNAKYALKLKKKLARLLPEGSLTWSALVDETAKYDIEKNCIRIYSPVAMFSKKPLFKTVSSMKGFKKTLTKELNEYVPEIVKSIDDSSSNSLLIYLDPSFMDSLKA